MTREEAVYRLNALLTMCDFRDAFGDRVDSKLYEDAVAMAIEALADVSGTNVGKWIPVLESLPKEDKNVLVTVHFHGSKNPPTRGSYYVEVANQMDGEWSSYSDEYKIAKDRHEVIAWMALPEPYKNYPG